MRLKILKRFKRSPDFYNLTVLVVPEIGQLKKIGEPVKTFTRLADELEYIIRLVRRDIQFTVVCVWRPVRRHL